MTLDHLTAYALHAMRGIPHINPAETLRILAFISPARREEVALTYAALIGEKTLPAHIGVRHALPVLQKPLAGRAKANRAAQARRILEDRREAA